MRKFLKSFVCAREGLGYTIRTQRNMRIHLLISAAVICAGIILRINRTEWVLLFLTFSMVMVTEIINTAIEKAVDLVTEEYHPLAGIVKNAAAGAVLLAALSAIIIGFTIFLPYLTGWVGGLK